MLLLTSAGAAGLGSAVSVSSRDMWAVLVRAGRVGHSSTLRRMLGDNVGESWCNTNGGMARLRFRAASWDSSMFLITLVVRLGAVGSRVGPRLWKFSDVQPLVQGLLICVKNQFNPATIKNDNGAVAMRIILCNANRTKKFIKLKKYNMF